MLKRRIRLRTEELRLVNEILKTLSKGEKIDKILEKVLQIFYSFWSIEAGFIAFKDERSGKLKVVASFGFLPSEVERAIYSKGEGITGLTYQLGIPLSATEDELVNKTGLVKRLKGKKLIFLTAPVKVGEQTVGVLGLFKNAEDLKEKTERLLETLSVVGSILGTFIQLREKEELPVLLSRELLKKLTLEGRLEGEYIFSLPSEAFKKVLQKVEFFKDLETPLLIKGETGVGKTAVAQLLVKLSRFSDKPLEVIDTSDLPEEELKKQFHQKVNKAKGGTLLVKRIENLPLELQYELVKHLKGESFRLIATSAVDLFEKTFEGKFLKTLYQLLETFSFEIPPLRERKEDIPPLVGFLLTKIGSHLGVDVEISPQLVEHLTEHPPRDNIRGLEIYLTRLITLLGGKGRITLEDAELFVPELFRKRTAPASRELEEPDGEKKFVDLLKEEEKERILRALEQTNYVKSRAAKMLGYTLRQLDYRLKKYGIDVNKLKRKR